MVYVLIITSGQVPVGAPSELVTVKLASAVQLSAIATPIASKAATVVTAAGTEVAEHPDTVAAVKVPVTVGAIKSETVIV
jgi:hypothetical protein